MEAIPQGAEALTPSGPRDLPAALPRCPPQAAWNDSAHLPGPGCYQASRDGHARPTRLPPGGAGTLTEPETMRLDCGLKLQQKT